MRSSKKTSPHHKYSQGISLWRLYSYPLLHISRCNVGGGMGRSTQARSGNREEGRGKREEGRGKREEERGDPSAGAN